MKAGTPALLASPGYPARLQVARGVPPALAHGRVGPTSPTRSLALPLLRVLTVLGVPLPEGVRGLLGSWGWPGFTVQVVGEGQSLALLAHALYPAGAGDRSQKGGRGRDKAVGRALGGGGRRMQGCQPLRVGITGLRVLQG